MAKRYEAKEVDVIQNVIGFKDSVEPQILSFVRSIAKHPYDVVCWLKLAGGNEQIAVIVDDNMVTGSCKTIQHGQRIFIITISEVEEADVQEEINTEKANDVENAVEEEDADEPEKQMSLKQLVRIFNNEEGDVKNDLVLQQNMVYLYNNICHRMVKEDHKDVIALKHYGVFQNKGHENPDNVGEILLIPVRYNVEDHVKDMVVID